MRKGQHTREAIAERAAPVFNQLGFAGTSIDALVKATGLQKGGLYNHYGSKEALALAAFDYAVQKQRERNIAALTAAADAGVLAQLEALGTSILRGYEDPAITGGCVVMNTAIDADDAHPALRDRARTAMCELLRTVGALVKQGIRCGELRADVDARLAASTMVALCQGALLLSKLFDDRSHVERAIAQLRAQLALMTEAR
jgi:AcrR family transcriptional regulator